MVIRWALIAAVLAGIVATVAACSPRGPETEIYRLDVRAVAGTDGTTQVTKVVTYRAVDIGHETGRDRTSLVRLGLLRNRHRTIRNVRVTTPAGAPLPARVERSPDRVDVAVPLTGAGHRTYVIAYQVRGVFTSTTGGLDFQHDLVGSAGDVTAWHTSIHFSAPGIVGASCQVKLQSERVPQRCDQVSVSGSPALGTVVARHDRPRTGEILFDVRLRPGAVAVTPPLPDPPFWVGHPVLTALMAAGPLSAIMLWIVLSPGRSARDRPRWRACPVGPPPGLRPEQIRFVEPPRRDTSTLAGHHLAALLVELALRGHLRIDSIADGPRWSITSLAVPPERGASTGPPASVPASLSPSATASAPGPEPEPEPYETAVLDALFKGRKTVDLAAVVTTSRALGRLVQQPSPSRGRRHDQLVRALLVVLAGSTIAAAGIFFWSILSHPLGRDRAPLIVPFIAGALVALGGRLWPEFSGVAPRRHHRSLARRLRRYRRRLLRAPAGATGSMTPHLPYAIALDIRAGWMESIGGPDHPVSWFSGPHASTGPRPGGSGVLAFADDLIAAERPFKVPPGPAPDAGVTPPKGN